MVRSAIDSVLAQKYPNLQLLIIDDGSTDDTDRVIGELGPSVRYHRQANAGAAAARNAGLRLANGDFVAFLDSDDLFLPGKLHEQVEYFHKNPSVVLVYCWYSIVDDSGRSRLGRRCRLTGNAADALLAQSMHGPLATPTVMARRAALLEAGGFDESMRLSEDTDLWCRVARLGPIGLIPKVLVEVHRHGTNLSGAPGRARYLAAAVRILDKAFAAHPKPSPWLQRRLYARAHVWSWLVAAGGLLPEALSFWLRAALTNPLTTALQWLGGSRDGDKHNRRPRHPGVQRRAA
jgi:glycosyltransferase involved in cell wall biosynthesis